MKILSLDGGGIRGVIQAELLCHLESASPTPGPIHTRFDLIAGTSTGGIQACCLSVGMPAAKIRDLYEKHGRVIFHKRMALRTGLLIPKYPAHGIEAALDEYLGGKWLSDCLCDILVPAFDFTTQRSLMMTSREPRATLGRSRNLPLFDVARRTSSAPVYFPAAEDRYHDGGVFANNPALIAVAEALAAGVDLSAISMLSIGTGVLGTAKPISVGAGGAVGLLPSLATIFMDAGADAVDYLMRQLLGDRYVRVQTDLSGISTAMDDASPAHVHDLVSAAASTITQSAWQAALKQF